MPTVTMKDTINGIIIASVTRNATALSDIILPVEVISKGSPDMLFEGHAMPGAYAYDDSAAAMDECAQDRGCGGVNFDTTTGKHYLMPRGAKLVRKNHYVAYAKLNHERPYHP